MFTRSPDHPIIGSPDEPIAGPLARRAKRVDYRSYEPRQGKDHRRLGDGASGGGKRSKGLNGTIHQGLVEMANLVTEMREVKHPYQKGIRAQRGIEY
jgi:hypothetical protein